RNASLTTNLDNLSLLDALPIYKNRKLSSFQSEVSRSRRAVRNCARESRDHLLVSDSGNVQAARFPYVWRDRNSGRRRCNLRLGDQKIPNQDAPERRRGLSPEEVSLG